MEDMCRNILQCSRWRNSFVCFTNTEIIASFILNMEQ